MLPPPGDSPAVQSCSSLFVDFKSFWFMYFFLRIISEESMVRETFEYIFLCEEGTGALWRRNGGKISIDLWVAVGVEVE